MMKKNYNFSTKTNPLSHQIDAINYIKKHKMIPFFDEQGLGKTKSVIDAMCYDLEYKKTDAVLIACKKTLLKTWGKEIQKHSYLDYTIFDGTRRQRGRSFMHLTKFYLISYESLLQELERIKLFLELKKFTIVLDESQKIKNPSSKITQALFIIKDMAKKRIIITGTPIDNKPSDIWSQFYFLDNGLTLGPSYTKFKKQFDVDLKNSDDLERYKHSLSLLKEKVSKVSIRRTKDVLELPEKVYHDVYVSLKSNQKHMYEKAKKELIIEIESADGSRIIKEIDNYLVKLLRLTQIASNPALLDKGYNECPAKFTLVDKLIKDIIEKKEKVILWSSFRKNIRALKNRYKSYRAVMLFGDMLTEEKDRSIEKFEEDSECKIMVANPAVASVGLTLIAANNVIYIDRNFKMGDYIQSQDRIHRIGQSRKCHIYKILARDTIDEYTDEIIEKKYIIAQYSLGDRDNLKGKKQFMTKEDILNILT